METPKIETGANYQLLNEARIELTRVWRELRFSRQPELSDGRSSNQVVMEAKALGAIAEDFRVAEEALFEVINAASSHEDGNAQDALSTLSVGLTATTKQEIEQAEYQQVQ